MALYEHVLISRPDISPAQVESQIEELGQWLESQGAKVGKTEYWGLRNLSYPILTTDLTGQSGPTTERPPRI